MLFHKWKSYEPCLLLTVLDTPILVGFNPLVLDTTFLSFPSQPSFPWLMITAAIAALLITFTFGKMAFTDAHGMPPSLVPLVNDVMTLLDCTQTTMSVQVDMVPFCKTPSRNMPTRPCGANLQTLFYLLPTSSYHSDTTFYGAQPSPKVW